MLDIKNAKGEKPRNAAHVDLIKISVKDRRDTVFGHKICLAGGVSNLILDCLIVEGNPADVDLAIPMLDRQMEIYGRYPHKECCPGPFFVSNRSRGASKKRRKQEKFLLLDGHYFINAQSINIQNGIDQAELYRKRQKRCTK
jgi:IS5 family transposase